MRLSKPYGLIVFLCFLFSLVFVHAEDLYLVTRVVDGDTIVLSNGERLRYIGVDTPETKHPKKGLQCYGKEASAFNKKLVEGKKVKLEFDVQQKDRYGRLLAYVYLEDGTFVNAELLRKGYAQVMTIPPVEFTMRR